MRSSYKCSENLVRRLYFLIYTKMSTKLCAQITRWISFAVELQSTYIAVSVINGLCSFVATVGNVIIILAIIKNSSLYTPSYALLCNLAVSDLGVGLISQPLFIALRIVEARGDKYLSCKLGIAYFSTAGCLAWLSLLTITAISFDRFLAVHLTTSYRSVVTLPRIKVTVTLLWLAAIVVGMTYVLDISVYFVLIMIIISVCLLFTTVNYLAIAQKLYGHSSQIRSHGKDARDKRRMRKSFNIGQYKKTVKSMLYIYSVFLLCYLPYLCFTVALKSIGRTSSVHGAYLITASFVLGNSAVNPCLYFWRIRELRQAVQQLFGLGQLSIRDVTSASTSESKV